MIDGAGKTRAELGRAEFEEDIGTLVWIRRLCKRTVEVRPGDIRSALAGRTTCSRA
jgi:hypothetical protein